MSHNVPLKIISKINLFKGYTKFFKINFLTLISKRPITFDCLDQIDTKNFLEITSRISFLNC